jgi:polyisoprenoid-binding protein YceI
MAVSTHSELDRLTGDYTIDVAHSRIGFIARHAMVTKVRGSFNDFEGWFHLDVDDPTKSSAKVIIKAKSIDTRNEQRDAHLRSNDFFAMDQYPEISFESTRVDRVDDTRFRLTGDLTIKDVTRPVTIDFEYMGAAIDPWGKVRIGFEGSTTVNRKDWGVNWNVALEAGGVLVSENVTLEFEIAAVKVDDSSV